MPYYYLLLSLRAHLARDTWNSRPDRDYFQMAVMYLLSGAPPAFQYMYLSKVGFFSDDICWQGCSFQFYYSFPARIFSLRMPIQRHKLWLLLIITQNPSVPLVAPSARNRQGLAKQTCMTCIGATLLCCSVESTLTKLFVCSTFCCQLLKTWVAKSIINGLNLTMDTMTNNGLDTNWWE